MVTASQSGEFGDSLLDPTLSHVERVERSLNMASRALYLELAGLTLDKDTLDPATIASLKAIGGATARIAHMADQLSGSIGEVIVEPVISEDKTVVVTAPVPQPILAVETIQAPDTEVTPPLSIPAMPAPTTPSVPVVEPTVEVPQAIETEAELDLYARIIPVELTPIMALPEGVEALEATIISPNEIRFNGKIVRLTGDRLFIFNSLMLQRQSAMSPDKVRQPGFRGSSPNFTNNMVGLMNFFNTDSLQIIKKFGERQSLLYAVNPALQLVEDFSTEPTDLPEGVKKN